jgi:hypothetical protein
VAFPWLEIPRGSKRLGGGGRRAVGGARWWPGPCVFIWGRLSLAAHGSHAHMVSTGLQAEGGTCCRTSPDSPGCLAAFPVLRCDLRRTPRAPGCVRVWSDQLLGPGLARRPYNLHRAQGLSTLPCGYSGQPCYVVRVVLTRHPWPFSLDTRSPYHLHPFVTIKSTSRRWQMSPRDQSHPKLNP